MHDLHDHHLTGCNPQALALLERSLAEFRCLRSDPLASVEAALDASPELVMGHLLRAWLYLSGTEAAAVPEVRASLARAAALPHNEREARYLQALTLLAERQWYRAGQAFEDLTIAYPRDVLALQIGHQIDFFTGDARMLRDRIARALPHWSPDIPGYHALLGMYAFGLEESGDYRLAERLGRESVALEPYDAWAQHAVAHVLEMQGRREEGIAWMQANPAWQQDNLLAVHNWWHLALYHLEQGDPARTLALFDGPVDGQRPTLALELLDSTALLWRLMLRGIDTGRRWQDLAERWEPMAADGHYAFNDFHAAQAFACAGRDDLLAELHQAQALAVQRCDDNARFTREVGLPGVAAVEAFVAGRYDECVDNLRRIRNHAQLFGGSHAQRDLIDQTLIAAARRGGNEALATALTNERQRLATQRALH